MNLVLFAGSLRQGSLNKKLLQNAYKILQADNEHQLQLIDLKALAMPVYDGDIEAVGIPESVQKMAQQVSAADAIIIASPEYNGSISSPLKNTIDWVSRVKPMPWERKSILLMGASPGYFGSIRALNHSKAPFEAVGAYVYPQTFALPKAAEAFISNDDFSDAQNTQKLNALLKTFLEFANKLKQNV